MSMSRKHLTLAFACVITCCITTSGCSFERNESRIGKYVIPLLPGWKHEGFDGKYLQDMTQSISAGKSMVSIKFTCFLPIPNTKVSTSAQDLSNEVASEERSMKDVAASSDFRSKTLTSVAMQYKSWPAYTTERQSSQSGRVTFSKILRFTDGQNLYTFQSNVGGSEIDPQAKLQADQAWTVLISSLRPAPIYNPWLVIGSLAALAGFVTLMIFLKHRFQVFNKLN